MFHRLEIPSHGLSFTFWDSENSTFCHRKEIQQENLLPLPLVNQSVSREDEKALGYCINKYTFGWAHGGAYSVLFCFLTLHSFSHKHTMITGLNPVHVCLHPFQQISQFGINTKFPCVSASNPPASNTFQVPLASKLTDQGTPTISLTGVYTPLIQACAQPRVVD